MCYENHKNYVRTHRCTPWGEEHTKSIKLDSYLFVMSLTSSRRKEVAVNHEGALGLIAV